MTYRQKNATLPLTSKTNAAIGVNKEGLVTSIATGTPYFNLVGTWTAADQIISQSILTAIGSWTLSSSTLGNDVTKSGTLFTFNTVGVYLVIFHTGFSTNLAAIKRVLLYNSAETTTYGGMITDNNPASMPGVTISTIIYANASDTLKFVLFCPTVQYTIDNTYLTIYRLSS